MGRTPKPGSTLSSLNLSLAPTFLLGLLCSSPCKEVPLGGHLSHPLCTQAHRTQDYSHLVWKTQRIKISKTEGIEEGPTQEAPPSFTASLVTRSAGEARPTLPSWPGSESPAGEGPPQPSRKPGFTWKGLGGGWQNPNPSWLVLEELGGYQRWLSSQPLSGTCQEVRNWATLGSLLSGALTLQGGVRWEFRLVHWSP